MATLIKQADLASSLRVLKVFKLDLTLSLAYYGLIHGDVSALHGHDDKVVTELHRDYKALIPASFDKKAKEWKYNRAKADKLAEKYGLVFQGMEFDEFCDAVCTEQDKVEVVVTPEEARKKVTDSVNRALVKALTAGISKAELSLMVAAARPKD